MRQRQIERLRRRALAGLIAVKAEHRLTARAPEQLQLIFRERGAAGGHGRDPGALERDHVEIALADAAGALVLASSRACLRRRAPGF